MHKRCKREFCRNKGIYMQGVCVERKTQAAVLLKNLKGGLVLETCSGVGLEKPNRP